MGSAPYEEDYWLACAGKAYARAEGLDERHARLTMLSVAKGYECLAHHERERAELVAIIQNGIRDKPSFPPHPQPRPYERVGPCGPFTAK
jgi:hypothetical protein